MQDKHSSQIFNYFHQTFRGSFEWNSRSCPWAQLSSLCSNAVRVAGRAQFWFLCLSLASSYNTWEHDTVINMRGQCDEVWEVCNWVTVACIRYKDSFSVPFSMPCSVAATVIIGNYCDFTFIYSPNTAFLTLYLFMNLLFWDIKKKSLTHTWAF